MSKTTPEWAEEIGRRLDGMVALRRDFHRHPELSFEERGEKTRVKITMDGRTKTLVPEFTIKGPMQEQLDGMAGALRKRIEQARA